MNHYCRCCASVLTPDNASAYLAELCPTCED